MSESAMTVEEIRSVLVQAISAELGMSADALATDRPFTEYGADSMAALAIAMEIEDTCGLSDLPTTLLWDYPTVDALAPALCRIKNDQPALTGREGR